MRVQPGVSSSCSVERAVSHSAARLKAGCSRLTASFVHTRQASTCSLRAHDRPSLMHEPTLVPPLISKRPARADGNGQPGCSATELAGCSEERVVCTRSLTGLQAQVEEEVGQQLVASLPAFWRGFNAAAWPRKRLQRSGRVSEDNGGEGAPPLTVVLMMGGATASST